MARRYLIETFGCQMNVHDSERMAGLLEQSGYEATHDPEDADVIVLNTCSVRERAEDKLFSRLGEIRQLQTRSGEAPLVAVAGCVAQQEGAALLTTAPGIDVVVGTGSVKRLPVLLEEAAATGQARVSVDPMEDVSFPLGLARRSDPVRAYVTIIEGCNDFCSFCVVPYTRGHERMRPLREVVADVAEAASSGRREVQLLGQIVNHYQAPDEPGCDFAELLVRVSEIPGIDRIRFASPHPRHVTARLIDSLRRLPKVCRHLHLPVQSGSSRILSLMRRRYTREQYLDLVADLREAVPGIALSTDMIVGFPGESPADFDETLSLTEAVRYHGMFSFKYSPRPNTLAAGRMADDVSEPEKTRRIMELQSVQRRIQIELNERTVGSHVEVLVDARSRRRETELSGRTSGNTVVNFAGPVDWLGRLVTVHVRRAGPHSLWGEAVAP